MERGKEISGSPSQRRRLNSAGESTELTYSGVLNERVLLLVFKFIKWDIHSLCQTASVSRKLHAVARQILWKELCVYRAPRMILALTDGVSSSRIGGGWHPLGKLLYYCCGCESTRHFELSQRVSGHFVKESRFSKTSGRSFLAKKCRGDLLFLSDPCEHVMRDKGDDLGVYRGVFRGFMKSITRACLIRSQVPLEENVWCPYCGARVWSMTAARLVPKSAARRLGSYDGDVEYFVCVNGHLYGTCWLVPLSSDEDNGGNKVNHDNDDVDDNVENGDGGGDTEEENGDDNSEENGGGDSYSDHMPTASRTHGVTFVDCNGNGWNIELCGSIHTINNHKLGL
ncbi:hypothetical protein LIER_41846 [Lithospermum erythrorhizon]|uniref:EID1-like F-box protein 3 n=1 Tax=Lithospermum erythrorhizon TaxID=34254 RepID=A0AAV3RFD7_LITER